MFQTTSATQSYPRPTGDTAPATELLLPKPSRRTLEMLSEDMAISEQISEQIRHGRCSSSGRGGVKTLQAR